MARKTVKVNKNLLDTIKDKIGSLGRKDKDKENLVGVLQKNTGGSKEGSKNVKAKGYNMGGAVVNTARAVADARPGKTAKVAKAAFERRPGKTAKVAKAVGSRLGRDMPTQSNKGQATATASRGFKKGGMVKAGASNPPTQGWKK